MYEQSHNTSEKSPLLTSGSRITAEKIDVTFHDSTTSDLDTSSRYGSVKVSNSYTSVSNNLHPSSSHLRVNPVDTAIVDLSSKTNYEKSKRRVSENDNSLEDEAYGTTNQPLEDDFLMGFFTVPPQDPSKLGPSVTRIVKPKQNSLVTIFSIWNTILGSSMLTMPWGIFMAGLIPGMVLILAMSGLCLYTAHKILQVHKYHGGGERIEVIELSRIFLGPWAEYAAKIFSISVLLGANITYWILMSNFLYNSVNFLYDFLADIPVQSFVSTEFRPEVALTVRCPKEELINGTRLLERSYGNLGPGWDLYRTVPLFLALLIFPVLNFNTTTFFTKFNALGTVSILYLIIFVLVKSSTWGINMSGTALDVIWDLRPSFPALSGMLALSFFIHNIIITIMQSNRDQNKNGRDLTIAYLLVTLTYFIVGVAFYISFPLTKSCIEDNLLNNFQNGDGLTVGARVVLFFQLFTVFPLIAYMLRIQLLSSVFKTAECARSSVLFVNAVMVGICVLFAIFMPYIGTIIRFTGAMSGLVYVFTLPSLFHIVISHRRGTATILSTCLHASITIVGVLNLTSQFFIREG